MSQSEDVDVITRWFNLGFHHILEKIFLDLGPQDILACKEVSPEWHNIVLFYHQSTIPRIVNLLKLRMRRSWKSLNPIRKSIILPTEAAKASLHIVADSDTIVVGFLPTSGNYHQSDVYVYDAETLDCVKILNPHHWDKDQVEEMSSIYLAMNDNYIVASVKFKPKSTLIFLISNMLVSVWNRKEKISEVKQEGHMTNMGCNGVSIQYDLTLRPHLQDDSVMMPLKPILGVAGNGFVFKKISLNNNKNIIKRFRKVSQGQTMEFIPVCEKYFLAAGTETISLHANSKSEVIWERGFNSQRCWLIGINSEYFAAVGVRPNTHVLVGRNLLQICRLTDGGTVRSIDFEGSYNSIYQVQIEDGRIAVQGWSKLNKDEIEWNIIVVDLETGDRLLACREDYGVNCDGSFLLQKNKLILENDCKEIVILQFWV